VSLRSSALGEDVYGHPSPVNIESLLNVTREYLILSFKEVLASKYSVPAITYRLTRGFYDDDIQMCVGCLEMIRAKAAGCPLFLGSFQCPD